MRERFRPPGHSKKQPLVEVTPATLQALGEPLVDYKRLNQLFREPKISLPKKVNPRIVLFGEAQWGFPSFHFSPTKTIYINAARCESKGEKHLTEMLLYQAKRLAFSTRYPVYNAFWNASYILIPVMEELAWNYRLEKELSIETLPLPVRLGIHGIVTGATLAAEYRYFKKSDARHLEATKVKKSQKLFKRYEDVIVFPNSPDRKTFKSS